MIRDENTEKNASKWGNWFDWWWGFRWTGQATDSFSGSGPVWFNDIDQYMRVELLFSAMLKNHISATDLPLDEKTINEFEKAYAVMDKSDAYSEHSVMSELEWYDSDNIGFKRLLQHLVKPILVLLDKENRDKQEAQDRALVHLGSITWGGVNRAIKTELTTLFQSYQMGQLIKGLEMLQADVSGLKQTSYIRERSKIENKGKIKPNDVYPPESDRAGRRDRLKAVSEMRLTMVIVERSFLFKERPYDYLLEACGVSNVITAKFDRLKKLWTDAREENHQLKSARKRQGNQ
jgi:hypothetical protein